jgi:hypothetical protein
MTPEERIAISKTYLAAPQEAANANNTKATIEAAKVDLVKKDNANKTLEKYTPLINVYQSEIGLLNGTVYTQLTESNLEDAANKKIGNFLYPNEKDVPLPSIPDGVWKYYLPFYGSYGIGKSKLETYGNNPANETTIIGNINSAIASLESSYTLIERTSGQNCTLAVPPLLVDTIATYAQLVTDLNALKTLVTSWQTNLNASLSALSTIASIDTDTARLTDKNNEQSSINTALSALTVWAALLDFKPVPVSVTTCVAFNGYNAALLAPTKLYTTNLNTFKSAISSRQGYLSTRTSQVSGYLGSVTQDLSSGDLTGGSGFYSNRAKIINLRLHLMTGTLVAVKNSERSSGAMDQLSKSKNEAVSTYQTVMFASAFKAPANGTDKLHVKDASGLAIGNKCYVASDTQGEMEVVIQAVSGFMLTLNKPVPVTYVDSENARIYKEL